MTNAIDCYFNDIYYMDGIVFRQCSTQHIKQTCDSFIIKQDTNANKTICNGAKKK